MHPEPAPQENIPRSERGDAPPLKESLDRAHAHYFAREYAEAESLCRDILASSPADPDALKLLGLLAYQGGRVADAEALLREAIRLDGDDPAHHNDLGLVLSGAGRSSDAVVSFKRAVALRPDYAEAWNNLGTVLRAAGESDQAIDAYRQAVAHLPTFAAAYYNLGNAYKERRLPDDAIAAYRRAVEVDPNLAPAWSNLGVVLKDTAQLVESIAATRRSLELRPDLTAASNLLCTLHYPDDCHPRELFREHVRYNQIYAQPLAASHVPHANDRDPERRLRIGYVSPDFSSHPVGCCLLPVAANHDHANFEIICYSDVRNPDGVTGRLRACADVWRETVRMPDAQLARVIRADRIDILVDLAVHTNENRLPVFARKPAPVQVTWLGWPGTTGLQTIDYRLSDPYLDPPTRTEWLYSERTVCLPHSFWCYGSLGDEPPVNALPALRNGIVTFGCFNNFCKITPGTLDLWGRSMSAVPNSRLLVMAPRGAARERLAAHLARHGIAPGRIGFVDRQPHQQYLELYHQIDVCLDSAPYAGHTTSMDSFWMGVPVVTIVGEIPVWRAGFSILSNLGMPELAAHTPAQYVQAAAALASDLSRLASLRATLRGRMESSPIMNGRQYARDLEQIFRQIWRAWCRRL